MKSKGWHRLLIMATRCCWPTDRRPAGESLREGYAEAFEPFLYLAVGSAARQAVFQSDVFKCGQFGKEHEVLREVSYVFLPQLLPASHVEAGGVHAVEEESAFEIGACAP